MVNRLVPSGLILVGSCAWKPSSSVLRIVGPWKLMTGCKGATEWSIQRNRFQLTWAAVASVRQQVALHCVSKQLTSFVEASADMLFKGLEVSLALCSWIACPGIPGKSANLQAESPGLVRLRVKKVILVQEGAVGLCGSLGLSHWISSCQTICKRSRCHD